MNSILVSALRLEERALAADVHASHAYQRLLEVRRLLALYDLPPPVGADLELLIEFGAMTAGRERPSVHRPIPVSDVA